MSKADRIRAIAAERPLATPIEIAREVGVSRQRVYQILPELAADQRATRIALCRELISAGEPVREVAKGLGIPEWTVRSYARGCFPHRELSHGRSGYNRGCRCEVCVEATIAARRKWKAGARLEPGDPRHGTDNAYRNFGCRCELCKAAGSIANKRTMANWEPKPLAPDDDRHGTYCAYNRYGCRCDECRAANAKKARRYYIRKKLDASRAAGVRSN